MKHNGARAPASTARAHPTAPSDDPATPDVPPPYDRAAEEAVVACLLVDDTALDRIASIVSPDDFFDGQAHDAFAACRALGQRGEAVNAVTVAHELARTDRFPDGTLLYLSRIVDDLPTPVGVESYAKIVRRDAVYRQLITFGSEVVRLAYAAGPDIQDVLDRTRADWARLRAALEALS